MNYNELKQLEYEVGDLVVSAGEEAVSITNKEGESVHLHTLEELEKLKDVFYDIKYWWEDRRKENE